MGPKLKAYLQLCRPANLPTAAADILAGVSISGLFATTQELQVPNQVPWSLLSLLLASVLLYAGGVVLNDVFDIKIDRVERPERPIPSGMVPLEKAKSFGFVLLVLGIGMAFLANSISGVISFLLATSIITYDKFAKHNTFFGPLTMGICRGLNLLMGITVLGHFQSWPYILVPILFIFAVTLVSRGENEGENRTNILWAGLLYIVVLLGVWYLHHSYSNGNLWYLVFLVLFGIMVFIPLLRAYKVNTPLNIKKAVKAGVLSIILLDAALAVGHSNIIIGVVTLMLLPLSLYLAKQFAVT